jgi:hypothetical protein
MIKPPSCPVVAFFGTQCRIMEINLDPEENPGNRAAGQSASADRIPQKS